MTKILCVPDVHLSDKPPSNCTDSYNDDLFVMLEEIVNLSKSRQIDAVAFAGDIFHSKIPMRTSHRTVQRMIGVVQSFECPVFLVPGNHDLQQDRIESLDTQPFGVLLHSGARLLSGWASGGQLPLYGVPWQQDWNGDYSDSFLSWVTEVDTRWDSNALLVTHAPLYPVGQELPWENVPAGHIALSMGTTGHCFYGHVHDYHGVFEVDGVTFCNHGALSRGSLHEEDLTRHPSVTIWHSDRSGVAAFERVKLSSARPADQVFRLAEHQAKIDYRDRLDVFLGAVRQSQVSVTSVESVLAEVRKMNLSAEELDLAESVLTAAIAGELK